LVLKRVHCLSRNPMAADVEKANVPAGCTDSFDGAARLLAGDQRCDVYDWNLIEVEASGDRNTHGVACLLSQNEEVCTANALKVKRPAASATALGSIDCSFALQSDSLTDGELLD